MRSSFVVKIQANVYVGNNLAGVLTEDDLGYEFRYDSDYLQSECADNLMFNGGFAAGLTVYNLYPDLNLK